MGTGMALNLMRAGHHLTVYNRTRDKAGPLIQEGATAADSPSESVRNAEALFTMLADDAALESVVFGADGISSALPEDAIHISASTISTALARKLTEEHRSRRQSFVSAPVFGRPDAAEAKRLIVVAAGMEKDVERCRPLLDAIGRMTVIAGTEPWQANAVKLCGNFMIASMLEAFGEAFAVMRKAGIEERLFLSVMAELFGSPVYKNYGTNIVERNYEPAGFALKLGLKDAKLAIENAQQLGAPMPFASVVKDHLVSAMAYGQAEMDWSSLAMVSARSAGLDLAGK